MSSVERRPTGLTWLPNSIRNNFIAFLGEFVGTFFFLFFAFAGTQVASNTSIHTPSPETLLYISLAFGVPLAVNVWIFYRVSGGHFNPAVTLGLVLSGAATPVRGVVNSVAQVVAGIAAAGLVSGLFPGPMSVRTSLSPGTSVVQGFFIETFCTAQLVLTVLMLAVEKHKSTFLAPIAIGTSLFIAELASVLYTGGSLNPARSFGPEVVAGKFVGHHWIYWIGPYFGAIIATAFYRLLKLLEYTTANPGQDFNETDVSLAKGRLVTDGTYDEERGFGPVMYSSGCLHRPSIPESSAKNTVEEIREVS